MTLRHVLVVALLAPAALAAQSRDTVRLGALHQRALATDPREAQRALLIAQSRLRNANISADLRPALALESHAQYQSDVARIPVALPGAASPPHDTYDARLAATQRIFDPTIGSRRALERAQLDASTARIDVTLHAVRQQVNETFFAALRAQEHTEELRNGVADLEAQLRVAESRVREGAALGSEAHAIRAELLRRRQLLLEWETHRRASLGVLADLTGASMDSATLLDAPDLAREVADVRAAIATLRARPEFGQFARARDLLAAQARLRGAQDQPRVSAFGRAGYGRPGLNPLATEFDSYWLAGVQLQWSPWTWGAGARDREVLALQQRIVEADERAFGDQLARAVAQDLATVDRLAATIGTDDEIIALRERIAAETRARYTEGAVTSAEYVDRQTDVLGARLTRAIHRTELAQARARVLTTLGIEVR